MVNKNSIPTDFHGNEIIDKYKIFYGIEKGLQKNWMLHDLYYELGYITLNDFLAGVITKELYNEFNGDENKELDLTLKYISPLLKEGKIKVRLTKEHKLTTSEKGQEYYKPTLRKEYSTEEYDEAIKDIEKYFLLCKDKEERSFFTMWRVQFTLPENEWKD